MRRRRFLNLAGMGGVAAISFRAQDLAPAPPAIACVDPDTGACYVPGVAPVAMDAAGASDFQKRDGSDLHRRPRWQAMTPDMRSEMTKDLRSAYLQLSGPKFKGTPFSVLAQSWLHQHHCCPPMEDHLYMGAVRNIHETAHFLPWHRAFLYFHERLLQAVLGKPEFRMPVWDWEAKGGNKVPEAYTGMPLVSDASTCAACVRNKEVDPIPEAQLQSWLAVDDFVNPIVDRNTNRYSPMASQGPHNDIHVGLSGFMSVVTTSAVDPLFYAHHANVDRMWEFWRRKHAANIELPHDPYYFYDAWPNPKSPKLVRITPQQLVETRDLAYDYALPGDSMAPVTQSPVLSVPASNAFTGFEDGDIRRFKSQIPAAVLQAAIGALGIGLDVSIAFLDAAGALLKLLPVKVAIPATLEFEATVKIKTRYVLQCADRNNQHGFRIGTFSIFESKGGTRRIAAALTLSVPDFAKIVVLASTGGFVLQYGALQADGKLTGLANLDPAQLILTIRLPKIT